MKFIEVTRYDGNIISVSVNAIKCFGETRGADKGSNAYITLGHGIAIYVTNTPMEIHELIKEATK
jgi:hypothetical protein